MRPDQRGFTLAELSAALFVVVAMATSTLALTTSILPRWRLRQASHDVATAIQAARARAVLDQTNVIMAFDTTRGLYALNSEVSSGKTATRADYTGTTRWFGALPTGVRFTRPTSGNAVTLAPPNASTETAAVFNSSGILQSVIRPGEVYLGVPAKQLYRRIRVTLTGAVVVETWNGLVWR